MIIPIQHKNDIHILFIRCKCGKRWMSAWPGDIYYIEDDITTDNLIRFVKSCSCMKKKKKKNDK